ncbi:hypothetical protein CYY_002945 [Polysphondylium violaceum]|uniref:Ras guanine nucleotide exchange factor n=1 Tax=Polysphondylium violaceum TaxID=133409 RepID=A0A8J4V1S7_9MYCE|nr:hypothetical protein CYY_002945 [Polysphondylium violaceum]
MMGQDQNSYQTRINDLEDENQKLRNRVGELETLNSYLKSQLEHFQTKFLESNLMNENSKDISSCLSEIYNSLSLESNNKVNTFEDDSVIDDSVEIYNEDEDYIVDESQSILNENYYNHDDEQNQYINSDSNQSSPIFYSANSSIIHNNNNNNQVQSNKPPPIPAKPAFLRRDSENSVGDGPSPSNSPRTIVPSQPISTTTTTTTQSEEPKKSSWSSAFIPKQRSDSILTQSKLNLNDSQSYSNRQINTSSSSTTSSSLTVEKKPPQPLPQIPDRRSKTSPFPTNSVSPLATSGHMTRTVSASAANAPKPHGLSSSSSSINVSNTSTNRIINAPPMNLSGSTPELPNAADLLEDEPENLDDPQLILVKNENGNYLVKGGTLEKLVQRLYYDRSHDTDFASAFLLTYRSFTTPIGLLDMLIAAFLNIGEIDETSSALAKKKRITRLRIANVFKNWIDKHYHDFQQDPELVEKMDIFIEKHVEHSLGDFGKIFKKLLHNERATPNPTWANEAPTPIPPKNKNTVNDLKFKDFDPTEVARQLTIIESDLYRKIESKECLNQAWNKEDKLEKSPNIVAFIKRFNQVSSWVATEIVRQEKLKDRVSYVKQFILIAQKCRELGNFNATMEILSGLQNSSVFRLRKTWEKIEAKPYIKKIYDDLLALMSSSGNYKEYIAALHSVHPPCIPYLGVYLTHLTFIEDGMKNTLNNQDDLINFEKRRKISVVIREIKQYQQQPYHLNVEETTINYLRNLPSVLTDKAMDKLSLMCEPREQRTSESSVTSPMSPEKENSRKDNNLGSSTSGLLKKEFSMQSLLSSFSSISKNNINNYQ